MLDRATLSELAEKYDSFYIYDEREIIADADRLKRSFPGASFLYSIKCNPAPAVMKAVLSRGFGADAASLAEARLAAGFGIGKDRIQYSAPGKTPADIRGALGIATLIADSPHEVGLIQAQAESAGAHAEIGVRINPDFTFDGAGGAPSKFGVDEAQAFAALEGWKRLENVSITGLHVHLKSQELDAKKLGGYYDRMLELAVRFRAALGAELKFVNLGSGIGIPYSEDEQPVDVAALGADLGRRFSERLPGTRVFIETGRYVTGKNGLYVTKVLDVKESHGKKFVILANTLNGFIRPSLALMAKGRSTPLEPLYTGSDTFRFIPLTDECERETVTLVGSLCTAADAVAADISLPKLRRGDLLAITNAGSYAAVLSPMGFASLTPPAQLALRADGTVADATAQIR